MDKAFIFDWSGTLNNNFDGFYEVCRLMFIDLGAEPLSKEDLRLNFTLPYMVFWNKYFPELTKEEQNKLHEKYIYTVGGTYLYPEVDVIIKKLFKNGFKLFIVSSDPISKLTSEIEKSGLIECFTKIIGDVHEKGILIKSIIDDFNIDKDRSFYVGDTSGDVEAGKIAGIKTFGITWGFQHKDILIKSKPDFIIDKIIDIDEMIINNDLR